MILTQRTVYPSAYLQATMQDNLSTQSGVNAQLFSSVLVPFNDVALNEIVLHKKYHFTSLCTQISHCSLTVFAMQILQLLVY